MNFLARILSEDNGNPSSMRMITALICLIVMLTWSYTCIKQGQLLPLDIEQIGLVLGALGLKTFQKGKEKPKTE